MADAAALLLIDSSEGLLPYPASSSKTPATAAATVDETAAGESEPKEVPKKGKKGGKGKRKTKAEADTEEGVEDADEDAEGGTKKAKTTDTPVNGSTASVPNLDPQQAAMVASFLGVLDADSLKAPTLPTPEEMGKVLLEVRKKALRDEYGV